MTRGGECLRVAVIVESFPDTGGGFHQSVSIAEALVSRRDAGHEFVALTPHRVTRDRLRAHGVEAHLFKNSVYRFLDLWSQTPLGYAVTQRLRRAGMRRVGRHLDALLDDHHVDFVVLAEAGEAGRRVGDHPFLITVWDLDHREHPDFPDAFRNHDSQRRDRILNDALPRATGVIVSCDYHARLLRQLYQVPPSRAVVLPFLPSRSVARHAAGDGRATAAAVRDKYALPEHFVFYPAYFLPQKNHLYLLEGILELERDHGIVLDVVLCGGPGAPDNSAAVRRQATALGLASRVRFLGIVSDDELPALYQAAFALVMPSFHGPTNLPPIEAAALGCPPVCSDLPGVREHMGEAALYCDLDRPGSLAEQLALIWNDAAVRERLQVAGATLTRELLGVDYAARLLPMLDRYAGLRRRWAWPPA